MCYNRESPHQRPCSRGCLTLDFQLPRLWCDTLSPLSPFHPSPLFLLSQGDLELIGSFCLSLVGLGLQVHTQLHLVELCTFDKCPSSGILLGWPETDYIRSILWNQQLLEMREGLRPRQPSPLSDNKARWSQGPELCWLCDILRPPSWQSYFVYASLIQCFMPKTLWGGRWQGGLGKMSLCFSFSFALIQVTNFSALELLFYIQQWKL